MLAQPEWTTIQTVQFLDKTAKFQEHLGRRETWVEAVDRTVTSLREQLVSNLGSKSQEAVDWAEISAGILALEVLPSMRLMQMAGPALERENLTAYNCVACAIDSPDSFVDLFYALMQTCGTGYSVERQFVNQMPLVERQHGGESRVYIIPDSTEGWCTALKNGLAAWFAGQDIEFVYDQIRPQGARLKTKGGYASGPEPLRKMLDFVRSKMLDAQGRKLRPIECHDIMCMIGDIVHVGGVRRAALCSLSDLDDEEMAMAKYGDSWFKDHLYRQMANNSAVVYGSRLPYESFKREWDALSASGSGERGLVNRESITLSSRRPYRDDYVFNPCFEIGLRGTHPLGGGQCCNLSQAVARPSDTIQSLAKKVRLASIIGTAQSAMTNFRFVRPGWKANCEEERLLGVDISGQMDTQIVGRYVDPELLLFMKNLAVITNKEFAKKLGINQSAAVTCNKPNGNSSVLLGVSSGLHTRRARHYIQRMRMMKTSPIAAMLRDAGVPYATAYGSDTLDVFEFPVAAPHGATVAGEMTAIEQLERWRLWKTNFTEHNPSTSIYVKQHEWPEVGSWVYANIGIIGGLSFFPFDDHVYPQAPWEPITQDEYDMRRAVMPAIKPEDLEKYENSTTGELLERQQEFACAGAQCVL